MLQKRTRNGFAAACRKRCAHPLAPSARGLRPQAVGERTVRLPEIFRAMARFSPSAPSGHLPRRGRFFDTLPQWICGSFFIGSLWQGRGEKRVLRENFLKKMRKSKKKAPALLYRECRGEHCSPANLVQQGFSGKALHIARGHGRAMLAPTEFYNGRMIYKQ